MPARGQLPAVTGNRNYPQPVKRLKPLALTFTVRAIISPDHYARIDVQDNGGPWNQGMIDPIRHHGLDIVRVVADEWGIDGDNTIRTIWARFDCPE